MEATTKRKLTQEDCETVRYLLKYGRTLKEIAEIIHVDPSTVGKIRLANYDLPTYLEQRKAMNRKTKENKRAAEAGRRRLNDLLDPMVNEERDKKILAQLEAEIPGQLKMELKDPSPAAQDDTKNLMKFQAAMMDKLLKKMDELIDVLKGGGKDE